jgi:hypothetical protein
MIDTRPPVLAPICLVVGALLGMAGTLAPSALFAVVSLQMFAGRSLTPLSEPLPFFAYPFLVFTMFGWAWSSVRRDRGQK